MTTPRVLIRGGALSCIRVSLPGIDVTTANLTQLAFDAQFVNLAVYMRGVAFFPYGLHTQSVSISFGETLSQPPLCFCSVAGFSGTNGSSPYFSHDISSGNETFGNVIVNTSGATFTTWAGVTSGAALEARYVLFRQLRT
jgi:hypothetical protein